jgi:hypothetical protein
MPDEHLSGLLECPVYEDVFGVRQITDDFLHRLGGVADESRNRQDWYPRASCGFLSRSMISSLYFPARCSSQIFLRFENASSDFGVCPAMYSRSSHMVSAPRPFDLGRAGLLSLNVTHFLAGVYAFGPDERTRARSARVSIGMDAGTQAQTSPIPWVAGSQSPREIVNERGAGRVSAAMHPPARSQAAASAVLST